ncbi:hypothetical protein A3Q56_07334 [Intoshia linei]|uniref:Alkyl transferase n=1 Tax=Intoshia linei TaxID=1819745 RepID=A0A177AU84_9BILA|nr:hypothetical protein A3Q56_07334 [Intoshia linei]
MYLYFLFFIIILSYLIINKPYKVLNKPIITIQQLCVKWLTKAIKLGPIPSHIAIIMDGNRRYAKSNNIPLLCGHKAGLDTLNNVSEWFYSVGVKEITIFAFAISNFNRQKDEVDYLMKMLSDNIDKLLDSRLKLMLSDLTIRFIGNSPLLDKHLIANMIKIESLTQPNPKNILNVAIAYDSTSEYTDTIFKLYNKQPKDLITHRKVCQNLYTYKSQKLDLVVRTSGETRLSNFMLIQSSYSQIYFVQKFWPVLSIFDLQKLIILYQKNYLYNK